MGAEEQYTATGRYSDGSTQDLTREVTWTAFTDGVAKISNAADSKGLATGTAVGTTVIVATLGDIAGEGTLTVTAATLESITVNPANVSIANGTQKQYLATGIFSDDSTQDLTTEVTWSSSNQQVAKILNTESGKGLATAEAVGKTTIKATLDDVSGTTELTVTRATLDTIEVTPSDPSIPNGGRQQFEATGIFTDNSKQDLTDSVTWSSGAEDVATISNASGSEGRASAKKVGTTLIKASSGEISGVSLLTVTAETLESIEVTPVEPVVTAGSKQQFKATGKYTDGSSRDLTSSVLWDSSNEDVAAISNADDSEGLAHSFIEGSTLIKATFEGASDSTTLTVTAARLVSIAVGPPNPSIPNGTQKQFGATGSYSDNSTQDLTEDVTWSSSDEDVAKILNTESGRGLATAGEEGVTTIKATLGSISGSTQLTVTGGTLDTIEVTPDDPSITSGSKQQFTATGIYTDNSKEDITDSVTWSSENDDVATISNANGSEGLATAKKVGETRITASLGDLSAVTLLRVTQAELQRIRVTPPNPEIPAGLTQQFTATGFYSDGSEKDLTKDVLWSSSDDEYVTISDDGLAKAVAQGEIITIRATLGEISGSTQVTVSDIIIIEIRVTPANSVQLTNTSVQMIATAIYSSDFEADQTQDADWSSSNPSFFVDNGAQKGRVSVGDQPGQTTITAKIGDVSGSTPMTAIPPGGDR